MQRIYGGERILMCKRTRNNKCIYTCYRGRGRGRGVLLIARGVADKWKVCLDGVTQSFHATTPPLSPTAILCTKIFPFTFTNTDCHFAISHSHIRWTLYITFSPPTIQLLLSVWCAALCHLAPLIDRHADDMSDSQAVYIKCLIICVLLLIYESH